MMGKEAVEKELHFIKADQSVQSSQRKDVSMSELVLNQSSDQQIRKRETLLTSFKTDLDYQSEGRNVSGVKLPNDSDVSPNEKSHLLKLESAEKPFLGSQNLELSSAKNSRIS